MLNGGGSSARTALLVSVLVLVASCGTTSNRRTSELDRKGNQSMQTPPWASPDALTRYCDQALLDAEARRTRLKGEHQPSQAGTLEPYNDMSKLIDTSMGWAALMFAVHPDKAIRSAAEVCKQRLAKFENDTKLDRALYDAVAAVPTAPLDAQARRFLTHLLRDFRRSGVDKDEKTRGRLAAIHEEIVKLGQSYQKNVREDVRKVKTSPASLKGLPADWIAARPAGDDGKHTITTDYPDFIPVQTYSEDPALRKELYGAFSARGYPANADVLKRLLTLRSEYAKLLGHPHWASYAAEDKMVKTHTVVADFIKKLGGIAKPRAKQDLAQLLTRKRKDHPGATEIRAWDRFFYRAKVREETHNFDARKVRVYFPYRQVKQGILDLYAELFGVEFERRTDLPTWHDSVDVYALKSGGDLIGVFYLDMHPRADKYKHAAMFGIQTGLDGERLPMASLVCNFPDPSDGDALMEHTQVQTFFHEFGHLLHHLLARRTRWVTLGGINVEWDFVEAPSQILEEWGWDHGVLSRFAKHHETKETIPANLVRRLRAADEFGKGTFVMRQLFYTAFSFFLHTRDPATLDLEKFTDEIYREYSPYPRLPGGRVYANFGHLVGYSSMYYTYQWSLVIAKDLFTRFQKAGLMDAGVAREYREKILEPGGTRDASELVQDFLGRPYNLDAYRSWLQR